VDDDDRKRLRRVLGAVALVAALAATGAGWWRATEEPPEGPSAGDRVASLRADRAALLARADPESRVRLARALADASLLTDALAVRHDHRAGEPFAALTEPHRHAFEAVDALNEAVAVVLDRPSPGLRADALARYRPVADSLARLAGTDPLPLVLDYTPRVIAPRLAPQEIALAQPPRALPAIEPSPRAASEASAPSRPTDAGPLPRYLPEFAAGEAREPPVVVEIVGLALDAGPAVLTVGGVRVTALGERHRLRFEIPRAALGGDAVRVRTVEPLLQIRRGGRLLSFRLPMLVLPDRPGSVALDERVREIVLESQTLVSPELLARAAAGETRATRRCFDPPEGWRFDRDSRRVVVVERLGWIEDAPDPTLNAGGVEFAPDEPPGQICVVVTARAAVRAARTATVGRFEVALLRERATTRVRRSGVRALDWQEPLRLPLDPEALERKLYVRLLDGFDIEVTNPIAGGAPFLGFVTPTEGGHLVLVVDPALAP